jgi:hypothetical protein
MAGAGTELRTAAGGIAPEGITNDGARTLNMQPHADRPRWV